MTSMLRGHEVQPAMRLPSIRRLLRVPSPTVPDEARPGVYAAKCKCEKIYVGETVRPYPDRCHGHRDPRTSSIARHVAEEDGDHRITEWKLVVATTDQLHGEIVEAILLDALPPSARMNAEPAGDESDDDAPRAKHVARVDPGWFAAAARWTHKWWEKVFTVENEGNNDEGSDSSDDDEQA